MSELEPLIADLALILICAGAMTLLFKRLKQPVVLGYIVAGFLAFMSPSLEKRSDSMTKIFTENLNKSGQNQ